MAAATLSPQATVSIGLAITVCAIVFAGYKIVAEMETSVSVLEATTRQDIGGLRGDIAGLKPELERIRSATEAVAAGSRADVQDMRDRIAALREQLTRETVQREALQRELTGLENRVRIIERSKGMAPQ
jgi:predicted RNase H-like nuclease (RuvC/YqgF family)